MAGLLHCLPQSSVPQSNGRDGLPDGGQPARRDRRRNDLANASNHSSPRKPSRDGLELGAVRIRSNPDADAQDRLRRLFTLLVRYATADGTASPETHSPEERDGGEGAK